MKQYLSLYSALFLCLLLCFSCNSDDEETTTIPTLPRLTVNDYDILEGATGQQSLDIQVQILDDYEGSLSVDYRTENISAQYGLDFVRASGQIEFNAPEKEKTITLSIISDTIKEGNENFRLTFFNAVGIEMIKSRANIKITNDDSETPQGVDGYETPEQYTGWNLVWADEFEGNALDTDTWTYELGDGCPELCGWGNNELESYTNDPENVFVQDGQLTIRAIKTGTATTPYTSGRIITKGKREYEYGRIDVRAKLPKGQGIWPAIWMLGANIDQVSWPACGEIDIMELIGHEPEVAHGTAHFGPAFPNNKFKTGSYSLTDGTDFSDRFHVFSVAWDVNTIYWYVDDFLYHELGTGDMQGSAYPFNNDFFFIFNVAVGGNWPGPPDNSTVFPQEMVVDYIRVFQQE
ncbi:MAG: family 16 glycosylhydrolase [Bacteroidota bacterium]